MKSRAHLKSHPIHPILVSFPIAFFIGSWGFDLLAYFLERPDFHNIAMYLEIAGIGLALIAAIPGIIDYMTVIPPHSSAKKRGAKHGLINITVVIIFSIALYLRRTQDISSILLIGIETVGIILLSIAGWLGGTLVYRNQIGVDIRYAHAGKWKEEYIKETSGEIPVADLDELQVNQMKLIHVKDKRIVVCRSEQGYKAFDDHCTHRGGSLAGGSMICGTVQCPWHGSQFDVHTGQVLAGPAKQNINTYPIKVAGTQVFLIL